MTASALKQKETLLIEMLLGSLDLRTSATAIGSPMLTQLADLLVARAREELDMIAVADRAAQPRGEAATKDA